MIHNPEAQKAQQAQQDREDRQGIGKDKRKILTRSKKYVKIGSQSDGREGSAGSFNSCSG